MESFIRRNLIMHSHVLWFIELLASSLDYTVLPKVNVKYCSTVR